MLQEIVLIECEESVRNKNELADNCTKLHLIVQNYLTSIEEQLERPRMGTALEVIPHSLK